MNARRAVTAPARRWASAVRWCAGLGALAIVTAWGAGTWYTHRDYQAWFLRERGRLVATTRQIVARTGRTTTYDLALRSDRGRRVDARLRVPNDPGRYPGVLVPAGLDVGRQVIDLVDERLAMVLLAVDFDWDREAYERLGFPAGPRKLWMKRQTGMDAVLNQLLALEILANEPKVKADEVVVVGVSYGTYPALAVAALEPRVDHLILIQGAAELGATIAHNAAADGMRLPRAPVRWVARTIFFPLLPERWVPRLAPRRVTFIASRDDPYFPPAAVQKVFDAASEPKQLIWMETGHVNADTPDLIAALMRQVVEVLESAPR